MKFNFTPRLNATFDKLGLGQWFVNGPDDDVPKIKIGDRRYLYARGIGVEEALCVGDDPEKYTVCAIQPIEITCAQITRE